MTFDIVADDAGALSGVVAHVSPHGISDLLGKPDGAVMLLNRSLHERHGIVAAVAAATDAAGRPVDAREVFVKPSFAAILRKEQAATTPSAIQASPQVVLVLGGTIPRDRMSRHNGLDPIECVVVDECVVATGNPPPPIDDDPNVVGIAQELVQARLTDRRGSTFGSWPTAQAKRLKMFSQSSKGPVARRVKVEGELHEWCPLAVHVDRANILVADEFASGYVANRRLERRPTT